ncbi:hypothetical protein TNCT_191001 [Trichonephila clavata]|uniref:BZIP domain-containing protein n=1 Tax=Trichonephila clavata TaxID=2740835 RepID=A0A8X6HGS7_TRICU|nr:hypothetical protein TNCT_191001 [Trichonephila clavata]
MAPIKSEPLDKNTAKSSPPTDTDVKYIDREIPDEPIDFSKKTKWTGSQELSSPPPHLLPTPLSYNFPNNRERPLILQPPYTPTNGPSTSQSYKPHSSVLNRLNSLDRGESLKNGNTSSPPRRKEMLKRWKNKSSFVEEVFKNLSPPNPYSAYNEQVNDAIRRSERQSTVEKISKPTLSSKSQDLFEIYRKFSNTNFPQVESEDMLRERRCIEQFCSGPFTGPIKHQRLESAPIVNSSSGSNTVRNKSSNTQNHYVSSHTQRRCSDEAFLPGPINHQILMSAPVANSLSRSKTLRNGSSNAHHYHISSYTQRRRSDESPSFSPSFRESTFLPGHESSNSFEEAPGIPVRSSDSSSSPSFLPSPFNGNSPEDPGSQLTTPIIFNGPWALRSGYSINVTPQPTHTQNRPNGHDENPDGIWDAQGRAKRRKGQNQQNGHDEEPDGNSNAKGRSRRRNGQNKPNGHDEKPDGKSNAKSRAKGHDGPNQPNNPDEEPDGNSNAKGRVKGCDGQNQSNVPKEEPDGISNAEGRAKSCDGQNQPNGHDEEPDGNSNAKGRAKRRKGQPVPEEEKDEKYLKKREKNNKAAYLSRKRRRARELKSQNDLQCAREQNEVLKLNCQELEYKLSMVEKFVCNPCFVKLRSFRLGLNLLSPPMDEH